MPQSEGVTAPIGSNGGTGASRREVHSPRGLSAEARVVIGVGAALAGTVLTVGVALAGLILAGQSSAAEDRRAIRGEIQDFRAAVGAEFKSVRAEFQSVRAEIRAVRIEIQAQVDQLRAEVQTEIHELRIEFRDLRAEVRKEIRAIRGDLPAAPEPEDR